VNDSRGLRPEVELGILHRSGISESRGYVHQPDGIYGCDAKNDVYRFIEVRHKDHSMARCRKPMDADPRTTGVIINVREVARPSPVLFVIECPGDAEEDDPLIFTSGYRGSRLFLYQGYCAVIDPLRAAREFNQGIGRGDQSVYFIPVDEFERTY